MTRSTSSMNGTMPVFCNRTDQPCLVYIVCTHISERSATLVFELDLSDTPQPWRATGMAATQRLEL